MLIISIYTYNNTGNTHLEYSRYNIVTCGENHALHLPPEIVITYLQLLGNIDQDFTRILSEII